MSPLTTLKLLGVTVTPDALLLFHKPVSNVANICVFHIGLRALCYIRLFIFLRCQFNSYANIWLKVKGGLL